MGLNLGLRMARGQAAARLIAPSDQPRDLCGLEMRRSFPQDCTIPTPGMRISRDTVFCAGTFDLSNSDEPIRIQGDDLALKCLDTLLLGNSRQPGIVLEGRGIAIVGCRLQGFYIGIGGNGERALIDGVAISEPAVAFIEFEGRAAPLHNVAICRSRLSNSAAPGAGVSCANCVNGTLADNEYANSYPAVESPITLINSHGMLVRGNTISSSGGAACNGLWLSDSSNNLLVGNTVLMRGGEGSHISGSNGNRFVDNRWEVASTQSDVIQMNSLSNGNQFSGNTFVRGVINDQGLNAWCPEGRRNIYLQGASYAGRDPHHGRCPAQP